MGRRIAILVHEDTPPEDLSRYAVSRLVPTWQADGHEVFPLFGVREQVPADLVFVHVDLSVVPDEYLAFAARYPTSVNGAVKDIRKSTFSPHLLGPEDPWPGPVMVKSDRNHGGLPEAVHGIARLDGRGIEPAFRTQNAYRIFSNLREVPAEFFASPDYVVQRFMPEMEDDRFHVRTYQFLGEWSLCTRMASEHPVVSAENMVAKGPARVHPEIEELRRRLHFDYGKFDYVVHDGAVVPLDLNKTTGGRRVDRAPTPQLAASRQERARALYGFFR
ncbi:MAG: hypothetical protein IPL96_00485 [Holophagaceae bacterium]|nr:hypothetical protein [Holophagaceae bacterium]